MKFSQILILSIFLLYSRYSYSLKCYTAVFSNAKDAAMNIHKVTECESEFCVTGTFKHGTEKMIFAKCDESNQCSEVGKKKNTVTGEEFLKSIGSDINKIPEKDRKSKIDVEQECCNTDKCNSASLSAEKNNKEKSDSSNSSGSFFCFHSYIKLFGALFISSLYKL